MSFLEHRRREAEWMDEANADPRALDRSLAFIRIVNRVFGYTRATLWHLDRLTRDWPADQPLRICDLATGSADVPRAILRWADRRKLNVRVVGVDLHPVTVAAAARGLRDPRLSIVQANVFALPFADASFDYVLTSMFLHHLDDAQVVRVLATMDRLASRGAIVSDLLRNRRAYAWITLFTLLANPMVKHDARTSVAQAFTPNEILQIRDAAKLNYAAYYRHFGHRFVLAGNKDAGAKRVT